MANQLSAFKEQIRQACEEIYSAVMEDKNKTTKGNYIWFNFDASIKIEVAINEKIDFDALLIEKCKSKLMELVEENITTNNSFIKELIVGAFQTSRGRLDTKKVLGLKKHASRIKDKRYQEAMEYLDQSIRRPSSTTYYRVFLRQTDGSYENIDLNFSSI